MTTALAQVTSKEPAPKSLRQDVLEICFAVGMSYDLTRRALALASEWEGGAA